ncbi:conserved hypothetical protein [Phenylobacterium zucineum HLK1]|uniref:Uncharacterized protein n=1 Tax=Phenylobacterium zucineum (strain HLK1) TaxID=450851 RepID=B4RC98_PHEZH|nr:hypothetical protein [Phenylobacterium zucineum]ACG79891.1 conserved hypothetical protein [Phenylobacterium zucineum HLK1]
MLKQRRMVAEQIAGALFEAEAAIDAALAKTAHLTGVMPSLRKQAGASALIGQDAVERASQAIMALAEARRAIVETHKELSVAQGQMGLGAVSFDPGSGEKPAPTAGMLERTGGRRLREIRAA